MGRAPCCDRKGLKKGAWTPEEDEILIEYIKKNGHGSWRSLPKLAGLLRCGKSCRLRWTNYLRPDIKRGPFTPEEEKLVIQLHGILGNRWAAIASKLRGRTDNEIKNLWNTHLKKRLRCMGIDPQTHKPSSTPNAPIKVIPSTSLSTRHMTQWENARLEAEARLSRESQLTVPPPSLPETTADTTDYLLRMWNSEVGESFRNFKGGGQHKNVVCQSPASQASSSTKYDSVSGITTERSPIMADNSLAAGGNGPNVEIYECKSRKVFDEEDVIAGGGADDSSCSNELEDSSESALQLLLDFPCFNNDMSFLEEHTDNYPAYSSVWLKDP